MARMRPFQTFSGYLPFHQALLGESLLLLTGAHGLATFEIACYTHTLSEWFE
jgi:hypothetical protein